MDLEKFSDDPDWYIHVFQGLTQTFILSSPLWKTVMLFVGQTPSELEK